jgi:hypothetical protein
MSKVDNPFAWVVRKDVLNKSTYELCLHTKQLLLRHFNVKDVEQSPVQSYLRKVNAIASNFVVKHTVREVNMTMSKKTGSQISKQGVVLVGTQCPYLL